jgi:hypothetical protein
MSTIVSRYDDGEEGHIDQYKNPNNQMGILFLTPVIISSLTIKLSGRSAICL